MTAEALIDTLRLPDIQKEALLSLLADSPGGQFDPRRLQRLRGIGATTIRLLTRHGHVLHASPGTPPPFDPQPLLASIARIETELAALRSALRAPPEKMVSPPPAPPGAQPSPAPAPCAPPCGCTPAPPPPHC